MIGAALRPFDVCGPLPEGVTVLEASAGTGKTYAIAALAARYVAGGTPLERLLLVTFTRMATGELRERVRERLVSAEEGLGRVLDGVPSPEDDQVLALLSEGSRDVVADRRTHLARAVADFDSATIATTHGFCQQVLAGLGVSGDVARDATFVEDLRGLVEEVVDDLYVRRFHAGGAPPFGRAEALRIGHAAVDNPLAPVEPRTAPDGSIPAMRRRLALAVREEVERRKRRLAVVSYDDLVTRLRAILADPARGPAASARLRDRYRVALVDEFQDTDPVQWEILRRAFADGEGTTLVLIGDPKQAIYAFRGADVHAYLAAARGARARATLEVNWRSDQGLIDAYDALFHGAKLGHEEIAHRPVRAAPAHRAPRLAGAPTDAPLRVRVLHRDDRLVRRTKNGWVVAAAGRDLVAKDLADDVVRLLSSPARVATPAGAWEPVRPGHVAVLVRTNRQAALVRNALDAVAVPAVINGAGSVFGTRPAMEWLRLLEALERPASPGRAASAALTAFVGWSAERLAGAGEPEREDLHTRLHGWAAVLRRAGVAALLEAVTRAEGLPGRVLARAEGERELTDLRHVAQLLHAAAADGRMGAAALTAWLRGRVAEAAADTDNEERSRRLESDAEAVQVLTIHRSKGLEFPIVYFPYLWEAPYIPDAVLPVFHDPDAGDLRTIDVGDGSGPDFDVHMARHVAEQRGEDLRLAYVALTRARHQAVVWWAASWDSRGSPLARLLFFRDEAGNVADEGAEPPGDGEVVMRLAVLAAAAPGCVSAERVTAGGGPRWSGPPLSASVLAAGSFDRNLDPAWRRTSYSAITAPLYEPRVASEPEEPVIGDEPGAGAPAPPAAPADADEVRLRAVPSLLAAMPAGVDVGTFVHRVLERADFAAPDLDAELAALVAEQRARGGEAGDPAVVVPGLAAAIRTPLGPQVDDLRLRDVARADRLDELAFELPLAGGETPRGGLAVADVAALLRRHMPPGDPLAGYPDRLEHPALAQSLRGYLTGSLDVVVRLRAPGGETRFAIIDHKTNWLGPPDEPLSAWHHRPSALAQAMLRAHYPLQALLYQVALHRYLRWRLPGYAPGRHLAGVLYLFLRGMSGAATPRVEGRPCGVFAWRPPDAMVTALSDLLDLGAAG